MVPERNEHFVPYRNGYLLPIMCGQYGRSNTIEVNKKEQNVFRWQQTYKKESNTEEDAKSWQNVVGWSKPTAGCEVNIGFIAVFVSESCASTSNNRAPLPHRSTPKISARTNSVLTFSIFFLSLLRVQFLNLLQVHISFSRLPPAKVDKEKKR